MFTRIKMKAFSDLEKELIRGKLLETGKEIFSRYGLSKTSIRDLAEKAGISSGSFYLFYPSKEDLFFEIISEQVRLSREAFQAEATRNTPLEPKQEISTFLHYAIQSISEDPILRILLEENNRAIFRNRFQNALTGKTDTDLVSGLQNIIQGWIDRGVIARGNTQAITRLFQTIFSAALRQGDGKPGIQSDSLALLVECVATGLTQKE
jgi:AcrR family transcriptional regulator